MVVCMLYLIEIIYSYYGRHVKCVCRLTFCSHCSGYPGGHVLGKSSPLSFLLVSCYTLCRFDCVYSFHVWCVVQFVCSGKHKLEVCFFLKEATQFYTFYCFIYIQNKWKFLKKDMHVYKRSLHVCTYFTFNCLNKRCPDAHELNI